MKIKPSGLWHNTVIIFYLMQKTLKNTFFKSKQIPVEATSTTNIVLEENGGKDDELSHDSSLKSPNSPQLSHDTTEKSYDCDAEPIADREAGGGIEGKLTSAQKLAAFAFTQTPAAPT